MKPEKIGKLLTAIAKEQDVDHAIPEQVMNDMAEPYLPHSYTLFPKCPDCTACPLSDSCQTRYKLTLARTVYATMTNMPSTKNLEWVMRKGVESIH